MRDLPGSKAVGPAKTLFCTLFLCLFSPFSPASKSIDLSHLQFQPAPLGSSANSAYQDLKASGPASGILNLSGAPGSGAGADTISAYQASISSSEAAEGPYAESIAEKALSLAQLYQTTGQHELALKTFEQALQVRRVNYGLYDLGQAPILRGMVESYMALGEIIHAHEKQQLLFSIYLQNYGPDDPEILPALLDWADWNVTLYLQQKSLDLNAEYFTSDPMQQRVSPNPILLQAQNIYIATMDLIKRQNGLGDPRLISIERKLASINYISNEELNNFLNHMPVSVGGDEGFNAYRRSLIQSNDAHFFSGSDALKRAIAYSYNTPNTETREIAERILELGDWYLLFDKRADALEIYQQALELLTDTPMSKEKIEEIMSPGMPVQIPEFENRFVRDKDTDFKGYIDVEFTLSKFGMASRAEVINASSQDKDDVARIERELMRSIHSCKFRPKFVAGSPAHQEKVRLRYYYTY